MSAFTTLVDLAKERKRKNGVKPPDNLEEQVLD